MGLDRGTQIMVSIDDRTTNIYCFALQHDPQFSFRAERISGMISRP